MVRLKSVPTTPSPRIAVEPKIPQTDGPDAPYRGFPAKLPTVRSESADVRKSGHLYPSLLKNDGAEDLRLPPLQDPTSYRSASPSISSSRESSSSPSPVPLVEQRTLPGLSSLIPTKKLYPDLKEDLAHGVDSMDIDEPLPKHRQRVDPEDAKLRHLELIKDLLVLVNASWKERRGVSSLPSATRKRSLLSSPPISSRDVEMASDSD
jgi:hypothetical protein